MKTKQLVESELATESVRLATNDGGWKAFKCRVSLTDYGATQLYVPSFDGTWLITEKEMFANVGGSDWRIYTLHPDDCATLTAKANEAKAGVA